MKISKILSYIVLAIGVISGGLLFKMNNGFDTLMTEAGASEARELPLGASIPEVSPLYNMALLIIALLIIATLVTIVGGLIKNPSSLKKTLIGIVIFLVIAGVAYAVSSGSEMQLKDNIVSANAVRWADAGIKAFYAFIVIAIGTIVWGGVRKSISK